MRILLALLLIFSFATPLMADPPASGIVTNDALSTDNFNWGYVVRGEYGWDDGLNLAIASIDTVCGILSNDTISTDTTRLRSRTSSPDVTAITIPLLYASIDAGGSFNHLLYYDGQNWYRVSMDLQTLIGIGK